MNRRADAYPISVIIMTAAIIAIVIVATAYITQALSSSSANLEFQTQQKTTTALGDIINSMAFKQYATDGIQMNLKFGDEEIFNSLGYNITIFYNSTQQLRLSLLKTANFSYVQNSGYIVLSGTTYLAGNGSLFASASSSLVNIFEWKAGRVAYISTLPRIQYTAQEVTFFNGTKATYVYLNYVRFNTTSTTLSHISFTNIFTFRTVASSLTVQTTKLVTGFLTVNVTSTNCSSGCSFPVRLPSPRTVVIVLSTSTITLSKG